MKRSSLSKIVFSFVVTSVISFTSQARTAGIITVSNINYVTDTMTFNVSVTGSVSLFVVRMCDPGSKWVKQNEGPTFSVPFTAPNPGCDDIAWGTQGNIKSQYTVAIPDIMALYGAQSLIYSAYLEADVITSSGKKRVLLSTTDFTILGR